VLLNKFDWSNKYWKEVELVFRLLNLYLKQVHMLS